MQAAIDPLTRVNIMSDQLTYEAETIHSWVNECKQLFDIEIHRLLLAHSSALVGKSKTLRTRRADNCEEWISRAEKFIDSRAAFVSKLSGSTQDLAASGRDYAVTSTF